MLKKLKDSLKAEVDPAFAKRAEFILDNIERKKPKKILDAGCGRGFYVKATSLFSFPKEIHGIDISSNYLKQAKQITEDDKRIKITKASIYSLPFPDNYFDFIIASEILEHLEDDNKALYELKRVLKKGGTIIATVPNKNFPFLWDPLNWILMKVFNTHINKDVWWLAGIWADHVRLYFEKELINLFKKSDLKVTETKLYIKYCWPFSHFILYGIGKNIVEKLGAKTFSRFEFKKNSSFSFLLALFFSIPSRFELEKPEKISVGIALKAVK